MISSQRMQPKRRPLLPLLFFLSFAALLLFFYHSSSSSRSSLLLSSSPNPDPRFTFIIKLLTFDRIDSLRRCLRSLAVADYTGDRVHLHVLVDHFRSLNSSSGAILDRKLEESRRILDLVDRLRWPHGDKIVHYRTANAGLQAQWLEAWWPSSNDEFAFVVEDDLELSPLYYKFLKGLILKYYFDPANYNPSIYGASLQRPRFVAVQKDLGLSKLALLAHSAPYCLIFLIDLARRGYPVIDADQLISSIRHDTSVYLEHETDVIRETWVKAIIVQKCLELGYNLWLIEGNMIPGSGSLSELPHPSYDFVVAEDVGLLFVKSSPPSVKMWNDDYIHKVVAECKSLIGSNSHLMEHKNFVHLARKALNDNADVRVWKLDDSAVGEKLGAITMNRTESKMKMVFWSQEMASALVQKELERLGMWLIDLDSSCVSVVCHKA
ncbi:hypothetical protein BHE74_00034693 [Ensete ventricosum]|nr:hypothetical protein BHE74_00034693 [Ensete ventricosum]